MATSYNQEIGDLVRQARETKGLSGNALAKLAGLSQPYLWQIEDGQIDVPSSTLVDIATALGIQPQDLMPPIPKAKKSRA